MKTKKRSLLAGLPILFFAVLAVAPVSADRPQAPLYAWRCATSAAPWAARVSHNMILFNNNLLVFGGWNALLNSRFNDIWASSNGSDWTQVVNHAPWDPRESAAAVVFDRKLWILAGTGYGDYNDVWCSPDGVEWTQATGSAAWTPRGASAIAAFKDGLWLLGGMTYPYGVDDAWYSQDGTNWSLALLDAPWTSRWSTSAVTFQGKLWIFGGAYLDESVGPSNLNDAWWTLDGTNWTQAPNAPWHPRIPYMTVLDSQLWLMGGNYVQGSGPHASGGIFNDVWRSPDGVTWVQEASAPWEARLGHAVASFDGKVWVSGGWRPDSYPYDPDPHPAAYLNDVWCMSPVTVSVTAENGAWRQEGDALDLRMAVSGVSEPIAYQWSKDGAPIAGATAGTFRIESVTASDAGSYACQATDQYGAVFPAAPVPIEVFPTGSLPAPCVALAFLGVGACLILGIHTLRKRRVVKRQAGC